LFLFSLKMSLFSGRFLVNGSDARKGAFPVLHSDVSLSFWGGIDEETGVVIDKNHPLAGKCVSDTILCLPSGRGSSTASQVLLELILNRKAPRALILRDRDGQVCVGAIVAQSMFPEADVLDIVQVDDYSNLLSVKPEYGQVLLDGSVIFGNDPDEIEETALTYSQGNLTGISRASLDVALTDEEQEMLDSAQSEAERRAAECVIRYGHITSDYPTYIDVSNAHIDGCTYIGNGGLKFVQRLVEEQGKVKIPTTLNAVSTDLRHWERLGIVPTTRQQASIEVANNYLALGCSEQSFTCAPYLLDSPPSQDQQIVWGESNAVVYANSVLGARTEKYSDYLDIMCALVGKVPALGVHLDENRKPRILLDASYVDFLDARNLDFDPQAFSLLFPVLGHLCGSLSDGEVPLLVGLEDYADQITKDHMKAFCAAFGTTAKSPLIHVAGVTPEARDHRRVQEMAEGCRERRTVITVEHLEETFRILDHQEETTSREDKIDWVALGNPHLSLSECDELADLVKGLPSPQRKHDDVKIIACMSRVLYEQSAAIPILREYGMEFVCDTCWCMLLHPPLIPSSKDAVILTNSGKYAHYGPGLTNRHFRLGNMQDCIQAAVSGTLQRKAPTSQPWKTQTRSLCSLTRQARDTKHSGLIPWSHTARIVLSRLKR
jgi:predicted aconitase/predicted aconitase with swiveling domain